MFHGLYSGLFLRLVFYYLSCPLILSWPLDIVIWYLVCFIDFVLSCFLDIIMTWFMSHVLWLPVEFFCIMINCCSDFFFSFFLVSMLFIILVTLYCREFFHWICRYLHQFLSLLWYIIINIIRIYTSCSITNYCAQYHRLWHWDQTDGW